MWPPSTDGCLGLTVTALLGLCLLLAAVYQFVFRHFNHFSDRGVKFIRGMPLLGSSYRVVLGLEPLALALHRFYSAFPGERLIGLYEIGGVPQYMLRDPHLIKEITIKSFKHFTNHRIAVDERSDLLAARNVFFVKDQKWREMRATLSPVFTGSKIREMLPLMTQCSEQFVAHLEANAHIDGGSLIGEVKDMFARITNDTIASCAFGLEVNSLKNRNNKFFRMGASLTEASTGFLLRHLGYCAMPSVMNALRIRIFKKRDEQYFRNMLQETVAYRRKNNVVRKDLINLLMEAQREAGYSADALSDADLEAQCVISYFAGFDTVSTMLSFMAYELAINADIQQRLYEEVVAVERELHGKAVTYESLNRMKYMNMVVSESLRKWPPVGMYDRICNRATSLDLGNGRRLQVNVGDGFIIPAYAIHRDADIYPQPERFDPERFSDENARNIVPAALLAFGMGPRSCIGARFALMEIKAIMYRTLLQWRLEPCGRTQQPLRLGPGLFLSTQKGIWLQFTRRQ